MKTIANKQLARVQVRKEVAEATASWRRRRPASEEEQLQRACVNYARMVLRPSVIFHHSVNEGKRSKAAAGAAKGMGQLAGFPDLVICWPFGKVGFIELKSQNGKLSAAQKAFRDWAFLSGHLWAEVRDIIEFKAVLKGWSVPHKGDYHHEPFRT